MKDRIGKVKTDLGKPELYIKIMDDTQGSTGGFYLFSSSKKDFSDGYDDWFEDLDQTMGQIEYRKWDIEWLDEEESKPSTPAPSSSDTPASN